MYEGGFQNDLRHGPGSLKYLLQSGDTLAVTYVDGKLSSAKTVSHGAGSILGSGDKTTLCVAGHSIPLGNIPSLLFSFLVMLCALLAGAVSTMGVANWVQSESGSQGSWATGLHFGRMLRGW